MAKYKISVPVDYADGHLRYGHLEAVFEFENLIEAQKFINSDEGKKEFADIADFKLDDYELYGYGDLIFTSKNIEEVK